MVDMDVLKSIKSNLQAKYWVWNTLSGKQSLTFVIVYIGIVLLLYVLIKCGFIIDNII